MQIPTSVSCAAVCFTAAAMESSAAPDDCIVFENFGEVSGLAVNGDAAVVESADGLVLRLTPAEGGPRAGSTFLTVPVPLDGFSTSFQFRIADVGGERIFDCNTEVGGDGLVFVLQADDARAVGGPGIGIGYSGIAPSLGIELDTWCNSHRNDPSSNHVGIDLNGVVHHGQGAPFTADVSPDFDNGEIWYVWIDYDGTAVEVRLAEVDDRPDAPAVSRDVDLATLLGQDTAFVGFTSGNWEAWGNHDILRWSIGFDPCSECTADLDLNGTVDFGDLLAVLAAWGPCEGPCPEDLDDSGGVDFGDLLAVLAAWGACPGGACCLPGEERCDEMSRWACIAAGGLYQGDGAACDDGCPPIGACCLAGDNCSVDTDEWCIEMGGVFLGAGITCPPSGCGELVDSCEDASLVADGAYAYSTLDATTDGPRLPAECDEGNGLYFRKDVWIRYRASCDGTALASICDSDYDTRLAVYEGSECVGALVACSDDACGVDGRRSEVTFPVASGEEYLVRIGGTAVTGSGVLVLQCSE